ncbi:MAG: Ldh family oxidoreductase [Alphaproteobacteria bacterium]|nr:Ldh family oxidoreductase [Alphaproteobacteria bacterium]
MSDGTLWFKAEDLDGLGRALFEAEGVPPGDAAIKSDCLVSANLRGVDSHGVARIPIYLKRLRSGLCKARPDIQVRRLTPVSALVDGDDGLGPVVSTRGMAECIAMAKQTGIGVVGIRRSTHFGMAAYYVLQALEADLVSFVFTNASRGMPAWGSIDPFLGTNPFAAGVPGGESGMPYLLDMATSVVARGKIRLAAQRGEAIPAGWALGPDGLPTTDGKEAMRGVVLPLAGYKGSGLAVLMDLLGGVMTGAAFAGLIRSAYNDWDAPQNTGHFFMCMRPDLFMPMAEFRMRMDVFVRRMKALRRTPDCAEILMPGEPETRKEAERRRTGIPLRPEPLAALAAEAEAGRITMPAGRAAPLG